MAAQLSMWEEAELADEPPAKPAPIEHVPGEPFPLMPHQERALEATLKGLIDYRSFLDVLPTGTGKTRLATEVVRRRKRDQVLFLAHRDEILQQSVDRLACDTGEMVGLDQAQFFGGDERIVVGSIQTISKPTRLERFQPSRFDLVIVDEAHHSLAKTYRRVIDYFAKAKILGLTATPDRKDEKAMSEVYDDFFVYDIEDAVTDGVLCDLKIAPFHIHGLDLSSVKTNAKGDLNEDQLEAIVSSEEVLLGYADVVLREAGQRKTVIFTPGVASAKGLAEIMNRHPGRDGCARSVDGKTESDLRRTTIRDHKNGRFQFLVNCGIVTEGYDDESIACIAQGRPTKSRSLSAQMIGRGLRKKKTGPFDDLLVIEFTGNAKPGFLSTPIDVLGGHHSDEEKELAQGFIEENPGMSARSALDKATAQMEREKQEQEEAARRAAIVAHAIYTKGGPINPFGVFHMDLHREIETAMRFGGKPISMKQINYLKWKGIPVPPGCNSKLAQRLIGTAIVREKYGKASFRELQALQQYGVNRVDISSAKAQEVLRTIDRNGKKPLSFAQLDSILCRQREPGE
ncbi:MAG TPA: DEAD/DEAH box helicase [Polyangia bacterium]|jgi:DNA or RNA helicases of superfamily II|nr:DEAD/DEAH box helicase [Polyangia bacterium]